MRGSNENDVLTVKWEGGFNKYFNDIFAVVFI